MCSALLTEGDRLNAGQLLESVERKLVARKLGNISQFAVLKSLATLTSKMNSQNIVNQNLLNLKNIQCIDLQLPDSE